MPINYKNYPKNWLTQIRPRIMLRANNTCESEHCDFKHLEEVYAVRYKGKTTGWFRDFNEANKQPKTIESKRNKKTGRVEPIPNPKKITVVLTIAHLDHDETNHEVKDDRLKALCQLCHLRYDAKEKYRRAQAQPVNSRYKYSSTFSTLSKDTAMSEPTKNTVTKEHIDSLIDNAPCQEAVFWGKELVASYKLPNGFTITGRAACVDPNNFNLDIGRNIARDNAKEQLWQLEGYLLQEKLHNQTETATPAAADLHETNAVANFKSL